MDCSFRYLKSTSNLENNKSICQKNFLFATELYLLTLELFFELCIFQGYIHNFERNWKIRFVSELKILINL